MIEETKNKILKLLRSNTPEEMDERREDLDKVPMDDLRQIALNTELSQAKRMVAAKILTEREYEENILGAPSLFQMEGMDIVVAYGIIEALVDLTWDKEE